MLSSSVAHAGADLHLLAAESGSEGGSSHAYVVGALVLLLLVVLVMATLAIGKGREHS